jgi:hypothetical protein
MTMEPTIQETFAGGMIYTVVIIYLAKETIRRWVASRTKGGA